MTAREKRQSTTRKVLAGGMIALAVLLLLTGSVLVLCAAGPAGYEDQGPYGPRGRGRSTTSQGLLEEALALVIILAPFAIGIGLIAWGMKICPPSLENLSKAMVDAQKMSLEGGEFGRIGRKMARRYATRIQELYPEANV